MLRDQYDVELWGAQFDRYGSDVWRPLQGSPISVKRYPGGELPRFLDSMERTAAAIDADVVYVSKPRFPSLGVGVLAKEAWNRPLVVDVDDFEPAFFDEQQGIDVDDLLRARSDPDLALPFGRLWTRACESVVGAVDTITVSNPVLEQRYGGTIVPHARDETVFDPARFDRATARRRLGLGDDDRLILFGGTPRAHKGIVELAEALERLGDDTIRVGVFGTRELDALRPQLGALERWLHPLPHQSFDELPSVLAAADLACALQSPTHPVSQYQMPAKVTDAMAMRVPCLVTPVPPLQPLIDKDVVEVFDGDVPLHQLIQRILRRDDETLDRADRARELFLERLSYAAVRPLLAGLIGEQIDAPAPLAPPLASLVGAARSLRRDSAATGVAAQPRSGSRTTRASTGAARTCS
jgi:glycosyltransferase involved in cell wall biosynthesis